MGLNVVLPCAGEGKRLGLPYPKEMHRIGPDTSLIELSLRLLEPYRERIDRVTCVITPRKTELVEFLARWQERLPIGFCFFDDRSFEWPGSILSAAPWFGERNLVMLPDSRLTEETDHPIVPTMERLLADDDVVFGYLPEASERLRALGALAVDGATGRVARFCDKPDDDLDRFNAFWTTFGFRADVGRPLLQTMMRSVRREPVELDSVGTVRAFPVAAYEDLGTWENLRRAEARERGELEPAAPRRLALLRAVGS